MKKIFILPYIIGIVVLAFSTNAKIITFPENKEKCQQMILEAEELMTEERYEDAKYVLMQCHNFYKAIEEEDENIDIPLYNLLYNCLHILGENDTLFYISKEKLDQTLIKFGPKSSEYLKDLISLANSYSYLNNLEEAINTGQECVALTEFIHGKNSVEYYFSVMNIGIYYLYGNEEEKGIAILKDLIDISKDFENIYMVTLHTQCYQSIVDYYLSQDRRDIALQFRNDLLEEEMKVLREIAPESLIEEIFYVARCFDENLNHEKAEQLMQEALNIAIEIYEKDSSSLRILYQELARCQVNIGDYANGMKNALEAKRLFDLYNENNTGEYAQLLKTFATLNYGNGEVEIAREQIESALSIIEKIHGQKNIQYLQGLLMLVDISIITDQTENIEKYLKIILGNIKEATEEINLEEFMTINISLLNLTHSLYQHGYLNHALHLGNWLFDFVDNHNEGHNPSIYPIVLDNLSAFYTAIGDWERAAELNKGCLEFYESMDNETLKKYQDDYLITWGNYIGILQEEGYYEEAIQKGEELLHIKSILYTEASADYIFTLHNLSSSYCIIGNYQKALELETKALNIAKQIECEGLLYFHIIDGLATINYRLGNYNEAKRLALEALNYNNEILNRDYHPLMTLIDIYYKIGDIKNLALTASIMTENLTQHLISSFESLSINERKVLWDQNGWGWFNFSLPLILYSTENKNLISKSLDGLIFSKGILLNSEIEFDKFLAETGKPELVEKYNEIRELRLQLNKLYEKPVAERWCDTDSLERVANNLERELMYESKEFGDYTRNLSITWQDVQKGLKQKDVAVEFVSFPLNQDSTMYMAYVLKPEMDSPQMVKLFEEKEFASLSSADNPAELYNKIEASNLIWRKLEPYLEGCENVYFAPDGILHQMAIEYLPDFNGEGTMADRYNLHRLSSTRQLAVIHDNNPSRSGAVFGGIEYSNDVNSMEQESEKYRDFNPLASVAPRAGELKLRASAGYLAGTKEEAEQVERTLKDNSYATKLLMGEEANEEAFKDLSGRNNGIIHIATHGFYWKQEKADSLARTNDRLMFMSTLDNNGPRHIEDRALTRSGLLMAGANNTLDKNRENQIPEGVDDGILTAQEIAQMNLRGTDLVVLSACQTGLGEISGDGVFGLQRGFKKAGANSLLMSLWKVDDDATQRLMEAFYRNLMAGQTKQQSLRNAQKFLRDEGFDDPKFWAAFILLDGLN